MAGNDMVQLGEGGPGYPWKWDDWPPPKRLWSRETNHGRQFASKVSETDMPNPKGEGWELWELVSASERPEPYKRSDNVFRGARYELITQPPTPGPGRPLPKEVLHRILDEIEIAAAEPEDFEDVDPQPQE